MKLTKKQLTTLFPQAGKNKALTGEIPMKFFRYFEEEIVELMKEENLTKYYRGSRVSNPTKTGICPLVTVRADARAVKIYVKA
jgi:hypothetical protein